MPTPDQMIAEYPLLAQRVAALEAQVAWFKKQVFGGGKSEKLDPAQKQLPLCGVDDARSAVVDHTEKITYERTKRREPRPTPAEAFAHIPVTGAKRRRHVLTLDKRLRREAGGTSRASRADTRPAVLLRRLGRFARSINRMRPSERLRGVA